MEILLPVTHAVSQQLAPGRNLFSRLTTVPNTALQLPLVLLSLALAFSLLLPAAVQAVSGIQRLLAALHQLVSISL